MSTNALPPWVREWLHDWPEGETRSVSRWMEWGGVWHRLRHLDRVIDLGYVMKAGTEHWRRTNKPVRLGKARTSSAGPWPWPIPHHMALVQNSPFAKHIKWVESLGQTLDEAIYRPQRLLRVSSKTRVRIVRAWLTKPELAYVPIWLEKFSSPVHVAIWCAILLVHPVERTAKGWRFTALDPEEAKHRLLSQSLGTIDQALQQLSER